MGKTRKKRSRPRTCGKRKTRVGGTFRKSIEKRSFWWDTLRNHFNNMFLRLFGMSA